MKDHCSMTDEERENFFLAALLHCGAYDFTSDPTDARKSNNIDFNKYIRKFNKFAKSCGLTTGEPTHQKSPNEENPYLFTQYFYYWRRHYTLQEVCDGQ